MEPLQKYMLKNQLKRIATKSRVLLIARDYAPDAKQAYMQVAKSYSLSLIQLTQSNVSAIRAISSVIDENLFLKGLYDIDRARELLRRTITSLCNAGVRLHLPDLNREERLVNEILGTYEVDHGNQLLQPLYVSAKVSFNPQGKLIIEIPYDTQNHASVDHLPELSRTIQRVNFAVGGLKDALVWIVESWEYGCATELTSLSLPDVMPLC